MIPLEQARELPMAVRGSQGGMAEAFLHPSVGRNARLESIAEQIDWSALEPVLCRLKPARTGAPPYPALMMFKALLLQQWYGLSDPGLEEALCDRMSFRRFVGLAADEAGPDHSTLWRFRQALSRQGLDREAFEAVAEQLDAQGLIVRQGTLIDASLVKAQSHPPPVADVEPGASRLVKSPREADADWTRRGSKRIFGYKLHVAVDQGSGLVRRAMLTPASINDTLVADDLIVGDEQSVWADKAYDSHARRARLRAMGLKNRICRRGNKHHAASPWTQKRNRAIARIRGRVETLFAVLKRHYGKGRARYLTLQRNQTDLILACLAINLRRALVLAR
jgi:IS5 family transposase